MSKYKYIVKSIDIDGDRVPDGDIFMKFKYTKRNGVVSAKLITVKYLNNTQINKFVSKIKKINHGGALHKKDVANEVMFVDSAKYPVSHTTPMVQIQQDSSFAGKLRDSFTFGLGAGAGATFGEAGANAVIEGVSGFFSDE
jgi:hypothetical protein